MFKKRASVLILIVLFSLLIFSIQSCKRKTPTPTPTPLLPTVTPTAQALPPALVETNPLPGEQIALKNPITFYFNQPMDRHSVEAALSGEPALSGKFTWRDDASLIFTPDSTLLPGTNLAINIADSAKSARGMAMLRPVSLTYTTGDYLKVVQNLPEDHTSEVNPTSAIVAAFNQPVVPLGADPASLPAGFTIEPAAEGNGEWINTSTYIFYPKPALFGGTSYQVTVNPNLFSTAGAPLRDATRWSFQTGMPRLVNAAPPDGMSNIRMDTAVKLDFSYSMDAASVEQNFSLTKNGDPVSGKSAWNEDFTTFTFTPTVLLERNTGYSMLLGANTAALGGTPIGAETHTSWFTVPELSIYSSEPSEGGVKATYAGIKLYVSSFIPTEKIEDYITIEPSAANIGAWMDEYEMTLNIWGTFDPDQDYTLTVSPNLTDLWGSRLGEPYILHFHTGPLDPAINFPYTSDATFLTTEDPGLLAYVTNLSSIPISIGTLTIDDLVQMYGENGYVFRENFTPRDAQNWTFHPQVPDNRSTTVTVPVTPSGGPREPGLYFMRFNIPSYQGYQTTIILAVSSYQATLKLTPTEAFLWAVDLKTNTPAASLPVTVYDQSGQQLATGTTDEAGVFQGPITAKQEPYSSSFALLGTPGEADFGFVFASWSDGLSPWNFDINTNYYPEKTRGYIYTDRPIYRPGDTIHFRAVVRQVSNGRYSLPDASSYPLQLMGALGEVVANFDLPLSGFGTAVGEYNLPSDAQPGSYSLFNTKSWDGVFFQVADYRKPDINLQVEFRSTEVISGTALVADVNARYFFDAPAGNMPVHWVLYRQNSDFSIPNYQVGPVNTDWLNAYNLPFGGYDGLGAYITEGSAHTDANGKLTIETPAPAWQGRQKYTLEVTLTDESGLPVSARNNVFVNPAEYYIGVHPDAWSYAANTPAGFEIQVMDLNGKPAGKRSLTAQFQGVVWVRHDPDPSLAGFEFPTYVPEFTPIDSEIITTDADGKARAVFTPPEAGTYQLDVSGDAALTQVIIWVGGEGQATYPSLPNQRLRLVANKDGYEPGDIAQIFVPNPFGGTALGMLTVERGEVMRSQTLHLEPGGSTIPVALGNDDAPNVIIAVTLLGQDEQGSPDFRQGYVNLPVDPSFQYLKVELTSQPERLGPGEPVAFSLRITDANNQPVQGEFSLAVVDLAIFSLADPYEKDISAYFYGEQPLSVRTGISLAASGQRLRYLPVGGGGGGGGEPASITRENFPDTAYWDAQVTTDANGEASVSMDLPDNLTTWQVLVRGLTKDTLVGEAKAEVITSKDLLIRPVTPRFLVVEDHAVLAAVVQNNTASELKGTATLQATGFVLDDTKSATQQVTVPANGRLRLEWWGTAENVEHASLRFSVQAGTLQDAVLVAKGALPVLHYAAPQTFSTSGSLAEDGERLELVSLPVTYDVSQGSLDVELDPSLAAAMLDALEALEDYPYDGAEQVLSRFLPNLVTYTTLQSFGIDSPDLKARLDRTLDEGLTHLLSLQNEDGGWGWWQGEESNATISAYALFGLVTAKDAGVTISQGALDKAVNYVSSQLLTPSPSTEGWELDRLAFENYALMKAGSGNQTSVNQLYDVRDQLSPWAQGLLALTLNEVSASSEKVQSIVSDLQATAVRSATGVHWEMKLYDWRNMTSTLSNSAMVVYTLAQLEPASTVLPDAVNFLMSNRNASGCWSSTYEDAWILLSMDEVMKGTGELTSGYQFSSSLNGSEIASGEAGGATQLNPVTTSLPINKLHPNDPNALVIQRDPGNGRLYYTAALNVYRPVEDVAALNRGISVSRAYFTSGADLKTASPVSSTKVGDMLTARLTVVVPNDTYHFVVDDYIPAGTEILNTSLKTTQLGMEGEPPPLYDSSDPYRKGWGWWLFNAPQIYADHISWTASYLPAGTYELTYTLVILQAGEYRVLPAHARMFYFPEVQGNSVGSILEIKP